jgi:LacI family transcriptional regulator
MITTKDLARICGVSRTTVDRALNGKDQIRAETRERIMRAAKENGYRPDLLARTLVKGRSMSIGAVVFSVRNSYFSDMLGAIQEEAGRRGYFVYFSFSDNSPDNEIKLVRDLIDRRVDGIILCPVSGGREFTRNFGDCGVPVVTVGNRLSARWHHVGTDDFAAAQAGLRYVIGKNLGYERFIFVCPPYRRRAQQNIYAQERRVKGFESFFEGRVEFESLVITSENYIDELKKNLSESGKKTLVFCSSSAYALGIIKAFRAGGEKIPGSRAGIISFDKTDAMEYITPALTVIDSSAAKQGAAAVDTLLALIAGRRAPAVKNVGFGICGGDSL